MRNRLITAAVVAVLGVSMAACGDQQAKESEATVPSIPTLPAASVKVTQSDLGPIVVDKLGRTLYVFTNDGRGESTCYDACAAAWPPALADAALDTDGLSAGAVVGTTTRKDGSKQLTLNGMPLYRFAADGDVPGQLKGQASKNVWFVVNGSGDVVRKAVAATSTTSTTVKSTTSTTSPRYSYGY